MSNKNKMKENESTSSKRENDNSSNTVPDQNINAFRDALTVGRKARIIETNNVKLRVAHLVGRIGKIVDVPVHPNTWYKVEFEDETSPVKFQATALVPLDKDDNDLFSYTKQQSDTKVTALNEETEFITFDKSLYESLPSLADKDPNNWIGKDVIIKSGARSGHLATVMRTGNGWIQLNVTGKKGKDYMVAKRAYELVAPVGKEVEAAVAKAVAERKKYMKKHQIEKSGDSVSEKSGSPTPISASHVSSSGRNKAIHVGFSVLVRHGQHEGRVGVVTNCGNGYFAVSVDGDVVRKRNSQLEVINSTFGSKLVRKSVQMFDTDQIGKVVSFDKTHSMYDIRVKKKIIKAALCKFKVLDSDSESTPVDSSDADLTTGRGKSGGDSANDDESSVATKPDRIRSLSVRARSNRRHQRAQRNAKSKYSKSSKVNQNLTKLQISQRERREVILQHVNRSLEKVYQYTPHRPNLQEHLEKIENHSLDDAEDYYLPLVVSVPYCSACKLEKLDKFEHCWNPACWKSPAYRPGAKPLTDDAIPSVKFRNGSYVYTDESPKRKGYIEVVEDETKDKQGGSRFTAALKRAEKDIVYSPLVDHCKSGKEIIIGKRKRPRAPPREKGLDGYFGRGWMYGNKNCATSDDDNSYYDESSNKGKAGLWLDDDENDEISLLEAAKLSLDFRWRSWKDELNVNSKYASKPHQTLTAAAELMTFATTLMKKDELKELQEEAKKINAKCESSTKAKPVPSVKPRSSSERIFSCTSTCICTCTYPITFAKHSFLYKQLYKDTCRDSNCSTCGKKS